MVDIVNLRLARKAKAKAEQSQRAADNRIQFGRSRAEREASEAEKRLVRRRIDGHHIGGAQKN
jgi:hypothetical protein